MSVEPIERLELEELEKEQKVGPAIVDNHMELIKNVKVRLEVKIGATNMSVGEIMELKENSVVVLDSDIAKPIDIVLDGKVIARGSLAASGDNFAIQITEVSK